MSTPITTLPIPTKQATKFDVGLDQVDNTADANKPVSTAQAAAIALKADASLLALYQPTATFRETMEDFLLSTFVPGANISIDYNDALNTFTFSVSGVTISDGDKGDITVSGTGTTWNVENGAITLAKMANMATGSVIGRNTAGTGVPEVLTYAALKSAMAFVKGDVGLALVDNTSDATKNAASATLTNKTLTAPVINSPTGIVKADVGLSNVDNTSDATKNSATATLTNKTLTSPVINTPTGIVKGDVGLGNVDNTSDTNKPISTAQAAGLAPKADPSFTGFMTTVGADIFTASPMAALAIDVTKNNNTKSIAVDSTFTFSGTPATANTLFAMRLKNTDTVSHVATIPGSYPEASGVPITTVTVPASSTVFLAWLYDGSQYNIFGAGIASGTNVNSHIVNYTMLAGDANSIQLHPASDNNARTFTIDSHANVPYDQGTALTFINRAVAALSIAITADTMTLAGTTTTGTRTLAQNGIATAIYDTANGWLINGTGLT